ncbi:copper resistance CopC family protein [Nonomuraea sp. NPDC003804]|uniref:copper resistance CopC family protein n=1 Tax=Nonomuraea sp. NPDC003804 TaxID=3154547 RepID=UPI0033B6B6D9
MRRLLTVLLLACAALGVAVAPAQAHNVLTGSDPAEGARLASAPEQVTLEFDQPARQGFTQVTVTGPDGGRWEAGQAAVSAKKVTARLRPLGPAGDYVIGYRILSADGHPISGKVTFTLTVAGTGVPASQAPAAEGAQGTTPGTVSGTDSGTARGAEGGAPGVPPADLSAQAAEAAANGGAGMAIVWVVGALVLLAGGTIVALRRAAPAGGPAAVAEGPRERPGPDAPADEDPAPAHPGQPVPGAGKGEA